MQKLAICFLVGTFSTLYCHYHIPPSPSYIMASEYQFMSVVLPQVNSMGEGRSVIGDSQILYTSILKGLSVNFYSKINFFANPQILHILRELHYHNWPIQQFSQEKTNKQTNKLINKQTNKQTNTFLERDNSLLLGIDVRWRKLIQASVSIKKSFKFWFSQVLVYFSIWKSNTYPFFTILDCYSSGLMRFIER